MSETLVERVAKALEASSANSFDAMARSAIAAMREPTPEMVFAAAEERKAGEKRNGHGNHAYRDEWQAMLDAALSAPPPHPTA